MYSMSVNNFCENLSPLLQLVGQVINIFKISLPLILICLGIFDIGKAVISSKTDDVKKNLKAFLYKLGICVIVFFVPTICMVIFGFVGGFSDIKKNSGLDYDVCYDCMFNPNSNNCKSSVELAENSPY